MKSLPRGGLPAVTFILSNLRLLALAALTPLLGFLGGCASMPDAAIPAKTSAYPALEIDPLAATAPAKSIPMRRKGVSAVTGRVLRPADMLQMLRVTAFSDNAYAEVNSVWLSQFYNHFREHLFKVGVVRWDERFNCKHFAGFYAEMAQARFYNENFHNGAAARTLALGPTWYYRDDGHGAHAVIVAITERGCVYIEPQTGKELHLSLTEEASAYMTLL